MRVATAAMLAALASASSASGQSLDAAGFNVAASANGVIAILGYTAVPDSTTSSLEINSASSGDPGLRQTQFGGAFTVADEFPLYLEGFAGISRYDPDFVFSGGARERRIPTKWTGFAATGGFGWDFPLYGDLDIRPIVNVSLGHVESDASLVGRFVSAELNEDLEFLENGRLNVWGVGGSLMLDFERVRPDHEIDVELRYTHISFRSFKSSEGVEGHADAQTAALWSRLRIPTGLTALDRPVRYVFEFAHSQFLGDTRGALGFNHLSQLGAGFELDSSDIGWVPLNRTRLVGRYVFGDNVSGFGIGIGVSF